MDMTTYILCKSSAKKYTDQVTQSLMSGVHYRGSVSYYDDLPANPAEGDAYTVKYSGASGTTPDGTEYVWGLDTDDNAYKWIGFSPDTYSKSEVDALLSGKQTTIDSSHKLSSDLVDDTDKTHKFATAAQLTQIATNETNILLIQQEIGDINTILEEVL